MQIVCHIRERPDTLSVLVQHSAYVISPKMPEHQHLIVTVRATQCEDVHSSRYLESLSIFTHRIDPRPNIHVLYRRVEICFGHHSHHCSVHATHVTRIRDLVSVLVELVLGVPSNSHAPADARRIYPVRAIQDTIAFQPGTGAKNTFCVAWSSCARNCLTLFDTASEPMTGVRLIASK